MYSLEQKNHRLVVAAMLSAIAWILQLFEFPLPFLVPPFVKLDFSELPALLASFSLGPIYGIAVCLVKNILKLLNGHSMAIGELANFLLGICFVVPAGVIYHHKKTRGGAMVAALVGAVCMALVSIPINYFVTYPLYTQVFFSGKVEDIVAMYQDIRPSVNGLLECLVLCNAPFTLLKGILDVLLAFFIYKPLSPLLHR